MDAALLWIVGSGLAMSAIALVGGVTLVLSERTQRRMLLPLVAFAAGSLLGGAFFHMLPVGLASGMSEVAVFVLLLAGFAVFFGRFALASAYLNSADLGVLVALAIAVHSLPEQFAMAVPAVATARRRVLFAAASAPALAEPAGAVAGLVAARWMPGHNSQLMAFAAGAMLFVSLHELPPLARRHGPLRNFVAVGASGVFAYWLLARLTVALA
jgi:zinc transporter ZupT